MTKSELLELISTLNFPKDEYYILSTAALVIYGIKDKCNDLDLCISEELYEELQKKYGITEEDKNECVFFSINESVEAVVEQKSNFKRAFEKGYLVEDLRTMLKFKRERMKAKDIRDIALIEAYLESQDR